jgi:hypothetical protein
VRYLRASPRTCTRLVLSLRPAALVQTIRLGLLFARCGVIILSVRLPGWACEQGGVMTTKREEFLKIWDSLDEARKCLFYPHLKDEPRQWLEEREQNDTLAE